MAAMATSLGMQYDGERREVGAAGYVTREQRGKRRLENPTPIPPTCEAPTFDLPWAATSMSYSAAEARPRDVLSTRQRI